MIIRILTLLAIWLIFIAITQIAPDKQIIVEEKSAFEKPPEISKAPILTIPKQDNRLNLNLIYKASWGGFDVASMSIRITPIEIGNQQAQMINANIKTHGMLKWATKYKSQTSATIIYDNQDNRDIFLPSIYKTEFSYRKKHRNILLEYSDDGAIILNESNLPPEKGWKRKAVPTTDKINVVDPLTLALIAREKIKYLYKNTHKKQFIIPLYDGRRRSNQVFTISDQLKAGLIKIELEEKPISGYTDNELKIFQEGQQIIELYLSPADFIPRKAKGQSPLGAAWVRLHKTCTIPNNNCK